MILFTVTTAGQTLINEAVIGVSPVLIDSIVLYDNGTPEKTITQFSGSVVNDQSGVGPSCKICFEDRSSSSYTITSISLKSGSIEVAVSETISITKQADVGKRIEISCVFEGAQKCVLPTYEISLPMATPFREGLVRFASENELHKDFTVYNSTTVDSMFDDIGHTLSGELVPWSTQEGSPVVGSVSLDKITLVDDYEDPEDSAIIQLSGATSGTPNISIGGYIVGDASISTPVVTSGQLASSPKVITEAYLSSLYSNTISSSTLTQLPSVNSVIEYVTDQIDTLDDTLVHINGVETITGTKTFSNGLSSSSYTGSGVQSETANWNTSANYSKLPTVEVVSTALNSLESDITEDYEAADSDLQQQIDALNAGQNLADIVNEKSDLASLDASKLDVNDKVQVLHDKTQSDGTVDPSATGIPTVYSLIQGTAPYPDPRDIAAYNKAGYYWEYIGEYGSDSYTKSESDTLFVAKASLDQTIASTSSTTNAPSTLAVYNSLSSLGSGYVKLISSAEQTITSSINITGQVVLNGVTYTAPFTSQTIFCNSYSQSRLFISWNSDHVRYGANDSYNYTNAYIELKVNNETSINLSIRQQSALKLLPILSGSTITGFNVSGKAVANYSAITPTPPSSATDGRLTTVDYVKSLIPSTTNFAQLDASNTFTGTTNTFTTVSATSYTGTGVYSSYSSSTWSTATTQLPTVSSVRSAISDSLKGISTVNSVGSLGLFLYTEVGAEKNIGDTVSGQYLKPVGMSLPISGMITYRSVSTASLTGTWKLLSVALRRTSTESCLVLAQKISES